MILSNELVARVPGPVSSVTDSRRRIGQGRHPDSYCCGSLHCACESLVSNAAQGSVGPTVPQMAVIVNGQTGPKGLCHGFGIVAVLGHADIATTAI